MKKLKSAYGGPRYAGQDYSNVVDLTIPDQSLSLQDILERFTRNETLPVDMGGEFGDEDFDNPLNVDLEKMGRADLTEKADYYNALEQLKKRYKAQEKAEADKAEAIAKKAEEDRIRAEILAGLTPEKPSA